MTYIPPTAEQPNKPWTIIEFKAQLDKNRDKWNKWKKEMYGDFMEQVQEEFAHDPNPIFRQEERPHHRDVIPFDLNRRINPDVARRVRTERRTRRTGDMDRLDLILVFRDKTKKRLEEKHNWKKEGF